MAIPRDDDLLAGLNGVEKAGEVGLGIIDGDGFHAPELLLTSPLVKGALREVVTPGTRRPWAEILPECADAPALPHHADLRRSPSISASSAWVDRRCWLRRAMPTS